MRNFLDSISPIRTDRERTIPAAFGVMFQISAHWLAVCQPLGTSSGWFAMASLSRFRSSAGANSVRSEAIGGGRVALSLRCIHRTRSRETMLEWIVVFLRNPLQECLPKCRYKSPSDFPLFDQSLDLLGEHEPQRNCQKSRRSHARSSHQTGLHVPIEIRPTCKTICRGSHCV